MNRTCLPLSCVRSFASDGACVADDGAHRPYRLRSRPRVSTSCCRLPLPRACNCGSGPAWFFPARREAPQDRRDYPCPLAPGRLYLGASTRRRSGEPGASRWSCLRDLLQAMQVASCVNGQRAWEVHGRSSLVRPGIWRQTVHGLIPRRRGGGCDIGAAPVPGIRLWVAGGSATHVGTMAACSGSLDMPVPGRLDRVGAWAAVAPGVPPLVAGTGLGGNLFERLSS